MAIVKLGTVVNAISGSIQATTFAHTKSGTVARGKLRQTRLSGLQVKLRNDMSRQRAAWRGLTDQQQQAWRVVALQLPRANRLGQRNVLSGYQLFIRTNMDGQRGATAEFTRLTPFTDPPELIAQAPNAVTAVTFSVSGGYFYTAVQNQTSADNIVAIYGARTFRDYDTRQVPSLRLFFQGGDFVVPIDITDEWDEHIGPPTQGEFVFLRFRWTYQLGGLYNLPLDFRVQVTA